MHFSNTNMFTGDFSMLELVLGRAGSGKTAYCFQAIKKFLQNKEDDSFAILIVPDYMTYKMELELAKYLPTRGFLHVNVTGFHRLSKAVLLETGGAVYPRISDLGKKILIKKILTKRKDELHFFGRSINKRGLTEVLAEIFAEFQTYGIDDKELGLFNKKENFLKENTAVSDFLEKKMHDLALIYNDFTQEVAKHYRDEENLEWEMSKKLAQSNIIKNAYIFIDGFIFFTPKDQEVLKNMLPLAKQISITLTLDPLNEEINNLTNSVFTIPNKTRATLKNMAHDLGIPIHVKKLPASKRFQNEELETIEKLFFMQEAKPLKRSGHVAIVEAVNRRVEIEQVASDIRILCREKNYHFQDIGILVRDTDSYGDLLERVFKEYDIPFFLSTKRLSVHHPLSELIRSLFDVVAGFHYDAVFRLLKTGLFLDVNRDVKLLENYVLEFGIRKKHWLSQDDWSFYRKDNFSEDVLKDGGEEKEIPLVWQEKLGRINRAKRAFTLPIFNFLNRLKSLSEIMCHKSEGQSKKNLFTARKITEALYFFLEELDVVNTLQKWALEAETNGNLSEAREHRQLWDDVVTLFDQIVEITGEEEMSLKEYQLLLEEGLDSLKMAIIPPGLDYVNIAPFDEHSLENFQAVYIVGLNEGVIPASLHDTGLLSELERLELQKRDINLKTGGIADILREYYFIYKAFTAPRQYLHLSYTLSDTEGGGKLPSSLVEDVKKALGITNILQLPLDVIARKDKYLISAPVQAVSSLGIALRNYAETGILEPHWREVYNWAKDKKATQSIFSMIIKGIFAKKDTSFLSKKTAKNLYLEGNKLKGSVTRFEKFHQCPFAHFASYGLRLRERKEYRFEAVDLGILLHETMRLYGISQKRKKLCFEDITPEERFAFCKTTLETLAQKLPNNIMESTAQYTYLLKRITKTADKSLGRLISYVEQSRLKPTFFEKDFAEKSTGFSPLQYPLFKVGEDVSLLVRGTIDRVDCSEDEQEFLVIDYKTGNMDISLNEVFWGLKLQLLTYIAVAKKSLSKADKIALPVGMLYSFLKNSLKVYSIPIDTAMIKDDLEKAFKMKGWLLNNPTIIRELDRDNKFLSVRLTKDGIHKSDLEKVKTEEEFNLLLDYIEQIFIETGEKILTGEISAQPYMLGKKKACTYCPYMSLCGFDENIAGYTYVDYSPTAKLKEKELMKKIRDKVLAMKKSRESD